MSVRVHIEHRLLSGQREFRLAVDFQTEQRRLALFGPSGAGKTMTLQSIAGLMRPERGHIALNGTTLFDSERDICLPPRERRLAYLFQDYALFPHLTVAQNIGFGLKPGWANPSRRRLPAAARRWVEAFELGHILESYPGEISGGQKQRVALARALALEPRALLLDEPFAALDTALRRKMRQELAALQRQLEIPMILITHDPDDVAELADEVYEIRAGAIIGTVDPAALALRGDPRVQAAA